MNDFERKLRDTPFRGPPPAWRDVILGPLPENERPAANWREWLWPPPLAWGALAATWLLLFAVDLSTSPAASARAVAAKPPPTDSLLAFRNEQALALLR